ncbi:uncharacterized protein LOC135197788 [Macrobrachium nipponense]|uniref:uncharacterized protein LOC135197788 n=1 Tax=Macrobrachium nipponense TaxID=159736 RepID=UPI0030C7EC69
MEQDFVQQGREQTWNSHSQTWDSHSHNEYQGGSAEQHENLDEEPQPVAFTKSKKRNKKLPLDSSQPTHIYFGEEGDHPISYQGSGEDSFRTSQKVRNKKFKKVSSVETSGSAESESSVGNILKKKKMSKKSSETNGKLKKNKMKTESDVTVADVNGLQVADSGGVSAIKGKKRQKVKDEAIDDSEEECQYMSEEDKEVTSSLSQKKMKMKAEEEKAVTQADISAFLDTTRARINYEFEDDRDLSNKSRNWYEQGWT